MAARPDKQIIWRSHYSPCECNNWFYYLVGISVILNEALDSIWFLKAEWCCALSSPTVGLCLHDVFSGPYLKSQQERWLLLLLLFVLSWCFSKRTILRIFCPFNQPAWLSLCVRVCVWSALFVCIFALSGKHWWAIWEAGRSTLMFFWRR